ncbi:DUF1007 family protein [Roseibacterium sp. SDUM158016]|uniref:DUF1007 family protein n=1 Tax=Roseicyclus sediminis TaxID=2980997 RepID=UPI0021D16C75|nr:DUF1007 family protein [Roseibacterium sp. SDUM158016]MCU4653573.1 DUF1007 family protein [Roseibacterium sp. SDUM158016]
MIRARGRSVLSLVLPLAGAVTLAAPMALAHPHVFIDAGVTLIVDDAGKVEAVEVTWRYDELYTLILLQDYGLDPDFDETLTEEEVAETLGFDLNWNSGFDGGLHLYRGATELALGRPEAVSLELRADGRMETVHRRPVTGDPGGEDQIEAQVYDEAFYVAFEATLPSGISGAGDCVPELVRADLDAAYERLQVELAAIGGAVAAEDNFPPVGAYFADRLVFQCVR